MKFRDILIREAEAVFNELIESEREEYYGFSFYTDDNFTWVDIAANTSQNLVARLSKLKIGRKKRIAEFEYKWYSTEWLVEGGFQHKLGGANKWMHDNEASSIESKLRIMDEFVWVLKALDERGLFSKKLARDNVVLEVSISDSDLDEQVFDSIIEQLNPSSVFDSFLKERNSAYE